ncbi:helix-turn-helix transcriptional regulator [Geodermatophilus sp. URMC 64]
MSTPGRQLPDLQAVAALADPVRRALFEHLRRADGPVTREAAAEAVGISRKLAAFHLDKLVAAGLLEARTGDGGGRGIGRRPKVYAPSGTEVRVTIPPRSPDLLAELLVEAVRTEQPTETAGEAALRVARARGAADGAAERSARRTGRLGAERALALAGAVLSRLGFEPVREAGTALRLRNCPFHPLAARDPELVCGINHAFVTGLLEGLQARTVDAALEPTPGQCCVRLQPARP